MSESPRDDLSNRTRRAGFAVLSDRTKLVTTVVLVLALLYSVLALGNIAVFLSLLLTAVFLWLLYRFVLAHERIADAQERRARAAEGDTGGTASRDDTSADARLDEFEADDRTGSDVDPDTGGD